MGFSINFSKNTEDIIDDKLKSPFWKNFILGWLTWNWKVWYVTFFVSESISGNKIDYIKGMYNYHDFYNVFPLLGFIVNWVIVPGLISYIMVYQLPKRLTDKFITEEQANKQRKNEAIEAGIKSDTKVLEAKKENIEITQELKNTEIENKHVRWNKEYNSFDFNVLEFLIELIYGNNGKVNTNLLNQVALTEKTLDRYVMVLDTSNLIEIIQSEPIMIYQITEKGKYFLQKIIQEDDFKINHDISVEGLPF